MLTSTQALTFLLAAMLLTATPGPDNLMVLGVGMSQGRRAGMAFGLGCAIGCLSHTLLAVMGVSALVAALPMAFMVLKGLGAAYLLWLGVQALRHSGAVQTRAAEAGAASLRQHFVKGLLANAVNPKVILFFLSFLPQFVVPAQGRMGWQIGLLGVLFTLQAVALFGWLGYCSGAVGAWLGRKPGAGRWLDRLAGFVFIALGIRILTLR